MNSAKLWMKLPEPKETLMESTAPSSKKPRPHF